MPFVFPYIESILNMSPSAKNNSVHHEIEQSREQQAPKLAEKGFECLIPVINKLRNVFDQTGESATVIQLPQIVVLGSQVSSLCRYMSRCLN